MALIELPVLSLITTQSHQKNRTFNSFRVRPIQPAVPSRDRAPQLVASHRSEPAESPAHGPELHGPATRSPVGMPSCLEPRPKPRTTWPRQKNGRLLMMLTSEGAGCSSLRACDGAAVSAAPGPGPAGDPAGAGGAGHLPLHYPVPARGTAVRRRNPAAARPELRQVCGPGDQPARLPLLPTAVATPPPLRPRPEASPRSALL